MGRITAIATLICMVGVGCATDTGEGNDDFRCTGGKCDEFGGETEGFVADMAALNAQWPGEVPVTQIEDAYRVTVDLGEMQLVADTHLFGGAVNVIPFHNDDNVTDAAGNAVERGDAVLASYFPPGEIGIGVMHHRPEHRILRLADPNLDMKEHFKFQDTHIEIVVGVERDGQPGVITMNNPQTYQNGRFGNPGYVPFFLRPVYPSYLSAAQQLAFRNNIRTMVAGFNAVSNFPGDYNGGDPLAAHSPERVIEHTTMMVRAIAGDEDARNWFQDPAHEIYCAELAHVSFSAGLIVPLNEATMVPLVGADTWNIFTSLVAAHNEGDPTPFSELNDNEFASLIDLELAPADLQAAASYASQDRADDATRIAFQPMTMADMVEQFMRAHIPREVLGESLAPVQGQVLTMMRPGLIESMGMQDVPETDPRRVAVDGLLDQIVATISVSYDDYDAFRAAIAPLLAQARAVTGPRDDTGTGYFVPPSLMHIVAQGYHAGGLMGLRYVGHGLNYSMVRPAGDEQPDPQPEPEPEPDAILLDETGDLTEGQELRFTVTAPQGATRLTVNMLADGDPDLYVRRGDAPDEQSYDCRPYLGADRDELCEFAPPGSDVYHIMLRGYGQSHYVLQASWE